MFCGCLARRPYPRNTHENQLSPSCPDSSHYSHVESTCFTSWETYSRVTRENSFSLQLPWVFIHSLSHIQPLQINPTWNVHKIKHNYNQIWHRIKANKNIVVNYNFTEMMQAWFKRAICWHTFYDFLYRQIYTHTLYTCTTTYKLYHIIYKTNMNNKMILGVNIIQCFNVKKPINR